MTDSPVREGGCRCGRVRFRVTAPPLLTMACHCTGCQRMTASAFSLSASIPLDGFAVIAGVPVDGGLQTPDAAFRHRHCGWCKSWLWSETPLGFVNVRATMFDDPTQFAPFVEMQTAEKLGWATTPAAHAFDRFPDPDAFPALVAAYPAWAAAHPN